MFIFAFMMKISINSRTIETPSQTIFYALIGRNHNGHNYVGELYQKGVRHFVVSESRPEFSSMTDAEFVYCPDTLVALQQRAADYRSELSAQMVGITGSNGKTVVKEWIAQLIADDIPLCRSPRSYNSQVGVPLSILEIDPNCKIALIEAGLSQKGEMDKLQKIIRPSVGIFTHLGDAHNENFKSTDEKLSEKCILFKDCDVVICRDGKIARKIASTLKPEAKMFLWGDSGLVVTLLELSNTFRKVHIYNDKGTDFVLTIPFTDEASFENCMSAVSYLIYRGYNTKVIAKRVLQLQPIGMRMEIKDGINDSLLIKDYYNSDLASFSLALNTLSSQDGSKEKVVILSDFIDVSTDNDSLYRHVAKLISQAGVSLFIGIGEYLSSHQHLFSDNGSYQSRFYRDTDGFLHQENRNNFSNRVILIKGARQYQFEYIGEFLQKQSHTTLLEVDMDAMSHNLNYFRSLVAPNTKIGVMVKAFAYGSGCGEIANLLQYQRVDYLMVAYVDEGVELRSKGITVPIAVMNPEPEAYDNMIEFDLEPEIYSMELLKSIDSALKSHSISHYPVHLKFNTGMNRSGLDLSEIPSLLDFFKSSRNVKIQSMFSHLAVSDDPSQDSFTLGQISLFEKMADMVQLHFDYHIIRHILNSAGIERFPQFAFDMVRLGIGLHGISAVPDNHSLEPVSSFITHITALRKVPADQTIGYGRKGHISRDSTIAVIPVGYADGLNRHLSCGVGEMYVNGHRVPIVGNICMDACMLDVTGIDAQVRDQVEIFGKHIPVTELSDKLGTIPYEILTGISQRVKRVYYKE